MGRLECQFGAYFHRCVAAQMPNAVHNPASNPTRETEAQTPRKVIGCEQIVG
jgi:hypothetical protein